MAGSPQPSLSLQTSFLLVREDTKAAVLLYLLQNVVRPQDQTVVFVATKHHAEYLTEVSQASRGWRSPWGSQTSFIWRPDLHFQRRPPEGGNRAPMSLGGAFSHTLTSEDTVNCQYHS